MLRRKLPSIHPGEILKEEFLKPFGISEYRLAKDTGVSARRINEIVHGERSVTANTALRFGKYFQTSPQFWLNLQSHYELEIEADYFEKELKNRVQIFSPILS